MKLALVILSLVLEIAFIIYCIHMTYLLDVFDPLPRELMIPNMLIGAAVLGFGYFMVTRLNKGLATLIERD